MRVVFYGHNKYPVYDFICGLPKKDQAPKKEIETAEKRLLEVMKDESFYFK